GGVIRLYLRKRFVRPRNDHLVRIRKPFPGREASARIRDDRVPAETACRGAERVGSVDCAVDEQSRWWPEDVREDPPAVQLDHLAVATSNHIAPNRIVAAPGSPSF